MGRVVAAFGVLIVLAACGGGGWMATRPSLGLFLVPGATDIQVVALGWNEWQISYHAPGSPTPWSSTVARNLEMDHWGSPDSVGYGALTRSYTRASSLAFCELWEWAFLSFDPVKPLVAQIRVRRWIAIPWRQFWPTRPGLGWGVYHSLTCYTTREISLSGSISYGE